VVCCTPFVNLAPAVEAAKGTHVKIGAENLHFEDKGAFTGEVSADMLVDLGVQYVIIGHSERREYFAETDETVNKKIKKALEKGLIPIVCCGESLEQREAGITMDFITIQIKKAFADISAADAKKVVVAYEPIWAIGTGKTATDDQAEEVCGAIRKVLEGLYDADTANNITIQYGGSMNASNCAGLLAKPNIDGGLIGGASLKSADFAVITGAAK
ncbi:MAG: triose-phosphate isomerase, partial [Clostridia bacterium]|nr:triose-phosphate isomerase [Clostridia bacterium]